MQDRCEVQHRLLRAGPRIGDVLRLMLGNAIGVLLAVLLLISKAYALGNDTRYDFYIEEETLGGALLELIHQADAQLLIPNELAETTGIIPVVGRYTIDEALTILLEGTGISGGLTKGGVIVISLGSIRPDREGTVTNRQLKKGLLAGVSAFLLGAGGAAAEADNANQEDVIVVTATKRGEQDLQDVPLAVQVMSGDSLERGRAHETADVMLRIPGADHMEQVGVALRGFSLRGSGATGAGTGDSLIGYYIDDVPFMTPNFQFSPPIRLLDIESVEVLRGPHGTLYGNGAGGGTVIFNTRDPNLDKMTVEGEVSTAMMEDAGNMNYGAAGAVSFPLIKDELGVRISGGYERRAGYADIYAGDPVGVPRETNANTITNWDIRGVILWQPTDNFEARAQIWHFEPYQDFSQSFSSVEPPYIANFGDVDSFEESVTTTYGLTMKWDVGPVTVTSSTAYLDTLIQYDRALPPIPLLPGIIRLVDVFESNSFTQELRVNSNSAGSFHWLVGGFYQDAETIFVEDAFVGGVQVIDSIQPLFTENYSFFGEVSYDLFGGKLVPLAGIRYYHDDRSFFSDAVNFGFPAFVAGEGESNVVTWRANLGYYPTDDLTLFFNAGTGFRSGQLQSALRVNSIEADGIDTDIALDPDELISYEAGVKANLFDGAVQAALSLYRVKYRDIAVGYFSTEGVGGLAPAGDAKIKGIDLELLWSTPIEGLNLGFIGNINDSAYANLIPIIDAQLPAINEGGKFVYNSKWSFRFDADYDREINDDWIFISNANLAVNSERVMIDGLVLSEVVLANASFGLRRGPYEFLVFGENLTDERGPTFVRNSQEFAGPFPRTIGVQFRFNFE